MADEKFGIEVFKNAIMDENISIQVDAVRRLPIMAAAMDTEKVREELLPCLMNIVDAMPEETLYNLAEQLERLLPLVGGKEHAETVLNLLVRLACEDEVLIRNRATDSMRNICLALDDEQCQNAFYPIIENLIQNDWFTTKSSAGCLIAICYSKMTQEKQTQLRNYFRNLIQDDSPLVRRSTATNLLELIPSLHQEDLKLEFIPVFDNLALDDQDSVRCLAVDVGVALSKRLTDFEVYEFLLKTFKMLVEDSSWRVRQRVACRIHEIQITEKNRFQIIAMYSKCVRDDEPEVRVHVAENVYNLVENLANSYNKQSENYQDVFEKFMEENVIPEIHLMLGDPSDDVRVALSTNILSLSALLRVECFNNNILPLVIDAFENDEFMPFKENVLRNLSWLPPNVDITKSVKCIKSVIQNLLEHSQMHWRTRRNLLLAFMHMTRNTSSEFFDTNLRFFYQFLLNDPIYAIRRIAPTILPVLMKQFGITWARNSLIPIFLPFAKDHRYLFRFVALFAVEEIISPTLNQDIENEGGKYLKDLKKNQSKVSKETLVKIVKLNERLEKELSETEIDTENSDSNNENLKFYGEDTLENLKKEPVRIFSITPAEIEDSYLEGVLVILVRDFVEIIKQLIHDPIQNVQDRVKITLKIVRNFCSDIKKESEQVWVQDVIKGMSEEDLRKMEEIIEKTLEKDEEICMIDCDVDDADTSSESLETGGASVESAETGAASTGTPETGGASAETPETGGTSAENPEMQDTSPENVEDENNNSGNR